MRFRVMSPRVLRIVVMMMIMMMISDAHSNAAISRSRIQKVTPMSEGRHYHIYKLTNGEEEQLEKHVLQKYWRASSRPGGDEIDGWIIELLKRCGGLLSVRNSHGRKVLLVGLIFDSYVHDMGDVTLREQWRLLSATIRYRDKRMFPMPDNMKQGLLDFASRFSDVARPIDRIHYMNSFLTARIRSLLIAGVHLPFRPKRQSDLSSEAMSVDRWIHEQCLPRVTTHQSDELNLPSASSSSSSSSSSLRGSAEDDVASIIHLQTPMDKYMSRVPHEFSLESLEDDPVLQSPAKRRQTNHHQRSNEE